MFCFAAQNCLQSDSGDIPFRDLADSGDLEVLPTGRQVIIASYQFQCCGHITRWRTYLNQRQDYIIRFQVWRPGPAVEIDGCYNLIAEDIEDDNERRHVRRFVRNDMLSVQPGDVLGYYITEDQQMESRMGIQLEQRFGEDSERVWYGSDTLNSMGNGCLFSVGNEEGRTLNLSTNSAPVFSVDVGKLKLYYRDA